MLIKHKLPNKTSFGFSIQCCQITIGFFLFNFCDNISLNLYRNKLSLYLLHLYIYEFNVALHPANLQKENLKRHPFLCTIKKSLKSCKQSTLQGSNHIQADQTNLWNFEHKHRLQQEKLLLISLTVPRRYHIHCKQLYVQKKITILHSRRKGNCWCVNWFTGDLPDLASLTVQTLLLLAPIVPL